MQDEDKEGRPGKGRERQGGRTKLRDLFKTSYPTVRGALNGETNSELARKIRHTAIERFGGVVLIREL